MSNLQGKAIVVFGAGGVIGSAVTKDLLDHGVHVIAVDINEQALRRLIYLNYDNLQIQILDITKDELLKHFFQEISKLDGVVNAMYPRNKTYGEHFFEVSLDSFNENISLQIGSTFNVLKQAAIFFEKKKTALSIVNISSIYGTMTPRFEIYENTKMTMPVEYSATKGAMNNLSKYVAKYINSNLFRINTVSPGGILDKQPPSFLEKYNEFCQGKGMLDEKDLLGAIRFFLSDDSKYIQGQNLIVDDGFHL